MSENIKIACRHILIEKQWQQNVTLQCDAQGIITHIHPYYDEQADHLLKGSVIPGMANVHSHAHQRAIIGLTEAASNKSDDNFWSWREVMYACLDQLNPEQLKAISAQLYVEMLKAGYTSVGEFQYLHHDLNGNHYDQKAHMSIACFEGAEQAGLAITMLPVLYRYSGFNRDKTNHGQRRFYNSNDDFLDIFMQCQQYIDGKQSEHNSLNSLYQCGIAPHSLRAASDTDIIECVSAVNKYCANTPIHIHIAEQLKEINDSIEATGARPVQWLYDHVDVDANWCLIHATHIDENEVDKIVASKAVVGLCPTTEANLGDGIFPLDDFYNKHGRAAIGSDSHIIINCAEELRMMELPQRLQNKARNVLQGSYASTASRLYIDTCKQGHDSIKQNAGVIAVSKRADLVELDNNHPRVYARKNQQLLDSWIFAADNDVVNNVFVAGRHQVKSGRHINEEEIYRGFCNAMDQLNLSK